MENKTRKDKTVAAAIFLSLLMLAVALIYRAGEAPAPDISTTADGTVLPVRWGDLGAQMIKSGVIDPEKFEAIYAASGGLDPYERDLLYEEGNSALVVNESNAEVILNLLWAFGLSNKSPVLETGPISDPRYGGASVFASTGGWTIPSTALGASAMDHFDAHPFITLTPGEQALVEKVARNIYRPCCDNPTYFPDCNHGMAMLGFLELMASQGASESEMYKAALILNQYWFPDTYANIAKYFESIGQSYADIDPKVILGKEYSSASGYAFVRSQREPASGPESGSCSVSS